MSSKIKILMVDDEANIRRMLRAALSATDFELLEAGTGREGIAAVATHNPEAVILDLGLPDLDGVDCIREVRKWSQVPILVLSARGEEQHKIAALDAGAYDYVTKPFSMSELMARLRVGLRLHHREPESPVFEGSGLRIDFAQHQVVVRGAAVHLTPLEFDLLALLSRHAGRVLTHRQLLSEVWGPAYAGQTHYVRILMKSLRNKVEQDPSRPKILLTESGVGYRFELV
ncbi:MAG: response regulator [Oligoflexia bacterium]|nr:response regulator [Oligoflexia bacterium]